MRCKICGYEIEQGKYVCPNCGTPVQIVPDFNEFEESLNELVGEDESELPELSDDIPESSDRRGRKKDTGKGKSHMLLLIAGILVLLGIGAILFGLSAYKVYREKNFSVDYQLEHARAAVREHDMATAISFYDKALTLSPDNAAIMREIADYYRTEEESEKAIEWYHKLLEKNPKDLELYSIIFDMYEETGDLDTVLAFREEAITPQQRDLYLPYGISDPRFSLDGRDFEDYKTVELYADPGLDIYYVINGNDPSERGVLYTDPIELSEEGTYIISAVCKNDKEMYSSVVSKIYNINIPAPVSPSLTPDGGDFVYKTTVFVSVPENCTAYYTLNGKAPDENSKPVNGLITIPEGNHILSVIAVDERTGKKSDVYSTRFTYYPQIEEPEEPAEEANTEGLASDSKEDQ